MDKTRWQHASQIFDAVVDRSPNDRVKILNSACQGDSELRCEVEALLSSHHVEGFLQPPDGGPLADGCEAFDFDADQDVDLTDFGEFQAALEDTAP